RVIEAPIITSFTRIGSGIRRRLDDWTDLDSYELTGRTIVLTGATSGLGLAAAEQLARCAASVVLVGRTPAKTSRVRDQLAAATGNEGLTTANADMGDLDAVRTLGEELADRHDRIDVLVHNAGALSAERRESPQGIEATVASQVVGPFLLTTLLLEPLRAGSPGRVLTMSSGGMYSAGLTVDGLQMDEHSYNGTKQYALAKRAQVTLNAMWAERVDRDEIVFHALHPGWADTPGVAKSLPTFRRVVGPLLRSPAEGADTLVWLAADDGDPLSSSGDFWHDRRRRGLHKLRKTRTADTPERRDRLWRWAQHAAEIHPA
ncbi:MAG: SDR family NAD(P)-dependent oxidoreductase, partial [Thermoleophilia bacterium]|nr:SDR family NAD(P)-dependent oxidoreductase [Thermoleophilia bacterium]